MPLFIALESSCWRAFPPWLHEGACPTPDGSGANPHHLSISHQRQCRAPALRGEDATEDMRRSDQIRRWSWVGVGVATLRGDILREAIAVIAGEQVIGQRVRVGGRQQDRKSV